jgi:hypothetical protein
MKSVAKNTFYKKINIDKAIAIKPNFSDLPLGGANTLINLSGGENETYFVLSGAKASTPAYGESTLIGGFLQVYCSGVTMTTSPTVPKLSLYKFKPDISIAEGTLQPSYRSAYGSPVTGSSIGSNVAVYRSSVASDNYYANENFDGADKTIGDVKIIRSLGNATAELDDAYLDFFTAKDESKNLGNIVGQKKEKSLQRYFQSAGKVPIKPEKDITGVWRPKIDKRDSHAKAVWSKPYWKWRDIKDKIQFDMKPAAASTPETEPLASAGNTIFDEIHATGDINNPFTSSEESPLMMTTAELSTAKKFSGGQAMRMYHLWDYSAQSINLQKAMGNNAITPSTTRASIYNLPRPHKGLDVSRKTIGGNGSFYSATPEISLRMNISKLLPTPFLAFNLGNEAKVDAFAMTSPSTSIPYGTTAISQMPTAISSMLRCVAITFSNYKPKADHTTLDKFLEYGLDRFYGSSTTENIVGGIIFKKDGINGSSLDGMNPNEVWASPIPVTQMMADTNASTSAHDSILSAYGMVKIDVTNVTGLNRTMLYGANNWFPSYNQDNSTADQRLIRQISLPMDSWFDTKILIDPDAKVTQATTLPFGPYGAKGASYATWGGMGSPYRVYFDTQLPQSGTTDSDDSTKKPFLDIVFPFKSGGSGIAGAYNFNDSPALYPKHMTVWVQNYRWVSGSTGVDYAGQAGLFFYGDNGDATDNDGPLPNGTAVEAELYIDDISLKNFTPQVRNASVGASRRANESLSFTQDSVVTPFTTFVSGNYKLRAWSDNSNPSDTIIESRDATEFIIYGYDDLEIWPTGNAAPATNAVSGYMLASGFSTSQYDVLARTTDTATSPDYNMGAFVSTSGNTAKDTNKYLGGQLYGAHYWVDGTSTIADVTSLKSSDINLTGTHTYTTKGGACNGLVNLMTGAAATLPSQDGFTSKGLMLFDIANTFDATAGWTKRENILVSTKIKSFSGLSGKTDVITSDNQLEVHDASIFNQYLDEEYVIFRLGSTVPSAATGSAATLGWGIHNSSLSIKLADSQSIDNGSNVITFNEKLKLGQLADDGSTALLTEDNLTDLWIGPKKYWLNLYQPANKVPRSINNFLVVQNVDNTGIANVPPSVASMQGTTWNESTYAFNDSASGVGQNGIYTNIWNPSIDPEDSSLVLNKDYGYGTYDEETNKGGEISRATPIPGQFVTLDLDGVAKDRDVGPDDSVILRLGTAGDFSSNVIQICSDEFGSTGDPKRPYIYWQYKDELPSFKNPIALSPNYDILSGSGENKVDLYKLDREDLNSLKFTWDEDAEDIVYRLLYVDSSPVQNKYHNIAFQAPLNELPVAGVATGSYYTGTARNAAGTFNTSTKRTITGSSGWAYDGNLATSTSAVDWPQVNGITGADRLSYFGNSEATFVVHAVPRDETTQTQGTLFTDNSTRGAFKIYYTKAASANANVTPVVSLTSGSTVVSGKTVTLTSDYSFPNDGESPLFVVVTFNANLDSNHIKMYVNGRLVKQSAGNWTKGNNLYDSASYDGKINIGNEADTGGTKKFRGTIQECIIHNKELYVPTAPNEYKLSTEFLPDKTAAGGTAVKYNARLFLFDYHNIIGTSRDTVCSSDEVSWEATPI